jgi:hypothetical protein
LVPRVFPGVGLKPGQHGLLLLELEVFLLDTLEEVFFGADLFVDFLAGLLFAVVMRS